MTHRVSPPLVYTAQSKQYFYCRDAVCEFVFAQGGVPLNPFRVFDYFLSGRVPQDQIRAANRRLITSCDELWVFGEELSDGVIVEIAQATKLGMAIRFLTISSDATQIREASPALVNFESEVIESTGLNVTDMRSRVKRGHTEELVVALGRLDEVNVRF